MMSKVICICEIAASWPVTFLVQFTGKRGFLGYVNLLRGHREPGYRITQPTYYSLFGWGTVLTVFHLNFALGILTFSFKPKSPTRVCEIYTSHCPPAGGEENGMHGHH